MSNAFGAYLKELRQKKRITLRSFCESNGLDPGNFSRLERGRFPAPQSEELLRKYALALDLTPGSDEWLTHFDLAAASRGMIPSDLMADEELVSKLPVLFRTLRGEPVEQEKLNLLIEEIRKN